MSDSLEVLAGQSTTLTGTPTYSSVQVDADGNLLITGAGTVVTITDFVLFEGGTGSFRLTGGSTTIVQGTAVFSGGPAQIGDATLDYADTTMDRPNVQFTATGGTLQLDRNFVGGSGVAIDGFTPGNTIRVTDGFDGESFTASADGGTLTLTRGGTVVQVLNLTGEPAGETLASFQFDATAGTVAVACFLRGTRIATPGGERAVERLAIGDEIITADGRAAPVRWIGRRDASAARVAADPALRPVRITAGALGAGVPVRDLYLSAQHAVSIGGMLVPAAALVDDAAITRVEPGAVDYFHIELSTHDVILAEGAPAETFFDAASRSGFDNAAEFARLYPDDLPRRHGRFAERVEEGDRLETIRAGMSGAAPAAMLPVTDGRLETVRRHRGQLVVEGWAVVDGAAPARLELLADGMVLAGFPANRYRADLDAAGLRGGRCGFRVTVADRPGPVVVRAVADGVVLRSVERAARAA